MTDQNREIRLALQAERMPPIPAAKMSAAQNDALAQPL